MNAPDVDMTIHLAAIVASSDDAILSKTLDGVILSSSSTPSLRDGRRSGRRAASEGIRRREREGEFERLLTVR